MKTGCTHATNPIESRTRARTDESYATYYDIHYPNEERRAGRPLKTGPTYERLRQL